MKKMLTAAGFLLVSCLVLSGSDKSRQPLADTHKANGVSCEDCHGKGPKKALEMEKCLECHESYAKVAERTKGLKPNPHDSHLLELDCTSCHHSHKAFELYCNTCHGDMTFEKK